LVPDIAILGTLLYWIVRGRRARRAPAVIAA
jgi:hypothetical protein